VKGDAEGMEEAIAFLKSFKSIGGTSQIKERNGNAENLRF
jgi:hypothetical protein